MVFVATSVLWSVFWQVAKVLSKLNSQHQLKYNLRVGVFKCLQITINCQQSCLFSHNILCCCYFNKFLSEIFGGFNFKKIGSGGLNTEFSRSKLMKSQQTKIEYCSSLRKIKKLYKER